MTRRRIFRLSTEIGRHLLLAACAAVAASLVHGCVPDSPDGGLPNHPSERFSVSLAWDAPEVDARGNPLDDLTAFRLYYSPFSPPNGPEGTAVDVGMTTEYTVQDLTAGVYYFAATALDEAGNESAPSEALRVEVGGP